VVDRTTNVVDYLQYNLHTPALRDVHVRRAIAMAINRTKLASAVYRGTLVPTDTVAARSALPNRESARGIQSTRGRELFA